MFIVQMMLKKIFKVNTHFVLSAPSSSKGRFEVDLGEKIESVNMQKLCKGWMSKKEKLAGRSIF